MTLGTAMFAALGVSLPLRIDPVYPGSIVDADDREVLVIDHTAERRDAEVSALALLIVRCVNAAEFNATDERDDEVKREEAALRIAKVLYSENFDPFERPEAFQHCAMIARAALSTDKG